MDSHGRRIGSVWDGRLDGRASSRLRRPRQPWLTAETTGMMEPLVDLGEMVEEGAPLLNIWPTTLTGKAPLTVPANRSGLLAGRHFPGLVQMGDCLAVIASIAAD